MLGRHFDRLVEVRALQKVVADHQLLGFGERTVGEEYLAVTDPDGDGVVGCESLAFQADARPSISLTQSLMSIAPSACAGSADGAFSRDGLPRLARVKLAL
jgi:hypothetical protein